MAMARADDEVSGPQGVEDCLTDAITLLIEDHRPSTRCFVRLEALIADDPRSVVTVP
jgi:hypothetical protein